MNSGESPYIFYYVLLIVLVASSLIGMRLPLRKAAKMILAWVAIFGAVFVIVAFRGEFANIGQRLRAEATEARSSPARQSASPCPMTGTSGSRRA